MKSFFTCFTIVSLLLALSISALAGVTTRVSVASDGTQGSWGMYCSICADGRYTAFESGATNLVPGDTNGTYDVFVHDRQTGMTERVSVASDGAEGNWTSSDPSISSDGRCVVFKSLSSNLVPGDTNGTWDIFVHDRQTGVTERVSVSSGGTEGNGSSSHYRGPSISADGRCVAFDSYSSNLVPGDTNGTSDVFVRDRQTGVTERVSVSSAGTQVYGYSFNPCISADGRCVAFDSSSSLLVPGDTNGQYDVFVHDRQTGVTERVSVASDGTQGNLHSGMYGSSISADGRYVAFTSEASTLVPGDTNGTHDVFVRDRQTGVTERVSVSSEGAQGNDRSNYPSINADGRQVAFWSFASNLVPGDTSTSDVFVHDRQTGETTRISVASDGTRGNMFSEYCSISADSRYVAFESWASNLVPGDTNGTYDVFVLDRWSVNDTKSFGDGQGAILSGNTVTASLSGAFYAEDADRSSGIKISWGGAVNEGDRYRIDGVLDTDENGERFIAASNVRRIDTLPVAPVGMIHRSLGGADSDYDPETGAGQQGIAGASGLNNIGLLVNVVGRVTFADAGNGYFYLDDGSALDDGSGHLGVKTLGIVPVEVGEDPVGKYVKVTGISSCFKVGSDLFRLIRSTEVTVITE